MVSARDTLHGLFETQARLRPQAIATIFDGVAVTYAEVERRAESLAAHLRNSLNVAAHDRVAIVGQRSNELIVGLLGILKAGAAYVPIDPGHPRDRIASMLEDARVKALIVDSPNAASAAAFSGGVFLLDVELESLQPAAAHVNVAADDLAYLIYTSGSTGRPKAVMVQHRAIVNTILWRNEFYGVSESDVNLQIPSFAFDSSVVDIFGFLAAGATLVIPSESQRLDPECLRRMIEAHKVTRLIATSGYYKRILPALTGSSHLASVTVAGEATSPALVREHFRHLPEIRLVNEYGPTENSVCSTACDLAAGENSVPAGRPIRAASLFIVNPALRCVAPGEIGEICVAGAGLARGYFERPALTAEKFIPCPWLGDGERMYRTGDLGFVDSCGTLEYVGRQDRQVKIRGFRVEPGEVESVLNRCPGVDDSLVLAKTDPFGERYLAAFVVSLQRIPSERIAGFARALVPEHMVPVTITVLAEFPLTVNGKTDVQILRAIPDGASARADTSEPRTETERDILRVCAALLARPSLAIRDNLFSVGATSLKAMEIVTQLRSAMKLRVDLADLYAFPTVADLAQHVAAVSGPRESLEKWTTATI